EAVKRPAGRAWRWTGLVRTAQADRQNREEREMARLLGCVLLCLALLIGSAPADAGGGFYKGKELRLVVRTTPRGGFDELTRLLARHMGKHVPGHPTTVVVNMPGGGGILAANYMAFQAPHDGTVLGIVSQGLATDQALGLSPQLKADLRSFNWIANVV